MAVRLTVFVLVRKAFWDGVTTDTDCRIPLPDNEARWDDMRMRLAGDAMLARLYTAQSITLRRFTLVVKV